MNAHIVVRNEGKIRAFEIQVVSTKDGITIIDMMFHALHSFPDDFRVNVLDDTYKENGWGIQKIGDRFLLQLMIFSPMNGFEKGHGSIYGYRIGQNPDTIGWPGVEFGKLPKHCLLTKTEIEPLLARLRMLAIQGRHSALSGTRKIGTSLVA